MRPTNDMMLAMAEWERQNPGKEYKRIEVDDLDKRLREAIGKDLDAAVESARTGVLVESLSGSDDILAEYIDAVLAQQGES